jgi:polyferredoxin
MDQVLLCPRARFGHEPFPRGGILRRLAARLESFFVRHRRSVALVHATMFVLFMALIFLPLLLDTPPEQAGPLDHLASFANYAIWGVWFPLVFLSVIFTGRSWCGLLCPMGAASEWANRAGPRLSIPRWVRWPGTPVASFLVVTIWAQTVGARDHALATAIVFGSLLAAALTLGFFFGRRKRAWCRHMCPIGLMLGVCSRIGAVDFHPKRPEPGGERWTEKTACPTMIDIDRKAESRHCIECFRCVSPKAEGGLYLRLRRPGEEIARIRQHNPNLAEVMFLFMGTGAALGGFMWLVLDSYQVIRRGLGDWIIERGWYWLGEPGPVWLMAVYPNEREVLRWFDFFLIGGYMIAWIALMTGLLAGATALAAWLSGRAGGDSTFAARFVELGYQFMPVAMVSLLLGLGGELFRNLEFAGLGPEGIGLVKFVLFLGGVLWSLRLGERLLARGGEHRRRRRLVPGALRLRREGRGPRVSDQG